MTDSFTFTKAIAFLIINLLRKLDLKGAKDVASESFRKGDVQGNRRQNQSFPALKFCHVSVSLSFEFSL